MGTWTRAARSGLIGGPLVLLSGTAVPFGIIDGGSSAQGLATIPEIIWEGGLTIYLIVKGFRATPLVDLTEGRAGVTAPPP